MSFGGFLQPLSPYLTFREDGVTGVKSLASGNQRLSGCVKWTEFRGASSSMQMRLGD